MFLFTLIIFLRICPLNVFADRKASLVVLPPLILGYEELYEDLETKETQTGKQPGIGKESGAEKIPDDGKVSDTEKESDGGNTTDDPKQPKGVNKTDGRKKLDVGKKPTVSEEQPPDSEMAEENMTAKVARGHYNLY